MSFARTYAKVSLAVAALIALHGVLAMKFDHAVDNFTMVLSIVTLLWLIVSGLAVLFFPEKRTPIWAPLTFIGYVFLNLILSVLMVLSFGRDEANTVFSKLNHHRDPIYYGQMIFAGVFALLNVFLLFRRSTDTPDADMTLQTVPSTEVDKELMPAPPQAIEQTPKAEPSQLPSQSTLNFSPETTESVTISVAVKEVVEVVVTKPQQIAAPIDMPAPPEKIELKEAPEAKAEAPEAKAEEPEVKLEEPEVKLEEPEVKVEEPDVKAEEPEAKVEQPEVKEADSKEEPSSEAPKEPAYEGTWDI